MVHYVCNLLHIFCIVRRLHNLQTVQCQLSRTLYCSHCRLHANSQTMQKVLYPWYFKVLVSLSRREPAKTEICNTPFCDEALCYVIHVLTHFFFLVSNMAKSFSTSACLRTSLTTCCRSSSALLRTCTQFTTPIVQSV